MTTLEPQTVDRGDTVPPYRARKPPEAIPVKLCGFDSGVLVLRCHDPAVAVEAIATAIVTRTLSPTMVPTVTGVRIWVRFVLDDYDNPAAGGVWERELRGTAGATPAVLFAREIPS